MAASKTTNELLTKEEMIAMLRGGHVKAFNAYREKRPHLPIDLSGADLSGARLMGVDLYAADLSGADLRGANLSLSDLKDTVFTRVTLIDGTVFRNSFGTPIAPEDILREIVRLRDAD